jgi:putative transposase
MDVVSRRWLTTLVSAQESSTQVEVAFTDALHAEGLAERIDARLLAQLRAGTVTPADLDGPESDGVPVLLVMSDNGPQMRSHSTKQFMAACAIMQRFGRPGTPTDQAWIESLFGHVKTEWPHLEKIRDAGELTLELDRAREQYNTVRLHAGIGYVTPDDEHYGRGDGIRQARRDGLLAARQARIAYRRSDRKDHS